MDRLPAHLILIGSRNHDETLAVGMQVEILKNSRDQYRSGRPLARIPGHESLIVSFVIGDHDMPVHTLEEKLPAVSRPDREPARISGNLPSAPAFQTLGIRPYKHLVPARFV